MGLDQENGGGGGASNLPDLGDVDNAVSPTKGSLLIPDGTSWKEVPVGADGTVLQADSSDDEGVVWAALNVGSSGIATIPSGSTSVDVTHGLGTTPNLRDLSVTPASSPGAATVWWISDATSTTFRINVDVDPGVSVDFAWHHASFDLQEQPAFDDPLSIDWHAAFWAEDPNWTDPGDGNAVSQWDDGSGNGRHATQGTGTKQPIYRASVAALNNKPAVEFDGSDDALQTSGFGTLSQPNDVVIVALWRGGGTGTLGLSDGIVSGSRHFVFVDDVGDNFSINSGSTIEGSQADTDGHLLIATFDTTDVLELDGVTDVSGDAGAQSLTGVTLGARYDAGGVFGDFTIAFYGVKDGLLTQQERDDLLEWSRDHYLTP